MQSKLCLVETRKKELLEEKKYNLQLFDIKVYWYQTPNVTSRKVKVNEIHLNFMVFVTWI